MEEWHVGKKCYGLRVTLSNSREEHSAERIALNYGLMRYDLSKWGQIFILYFGQDGIVEGWEKMLRVN